MRQKFTADLRLLIGEKDDDSMKYENDNGIDGTSAIFICEERINVFEKYQYRFI